MDHLRNYWQGSMRETSTGRLDIPTTTSSASDAEMKSESSQFETKQGFEIAERASKAFLNECIKETRADDTTHR